MDSGLRDKVVLITGASGGIGGATARAFAAEGARLALHAYRNLPSVENLKDELAVESIALKGDVTNEAEVDAMFEETEKRFGSVDVLVANAGIWHAEAAPIHATSLERWNETIAADQTSVFLCARAFFRLLKKRRPETASLIIVGSTSAVFGAEGHCAYASAKAAIIYGLTKTLKNEIVRLAPLGRVNAVAPGWTFTPMAEEALSDARVLKQVLQTRSIKKIARVEDVANAIVFLASDKLAGHISGEVVTIAGGMEGRVIHEADKIDPGYA